MTEGEDTRGPEQQGKPPQDDETREPHSSATPLPLLDANDPATSSETVEVLAIGDPAASSETVEVLAVDDPAANAPTAPMATVAPANKTDAASEEIAAAAAAAAAAAEAAHAPTEEVSATQAAEEMAAVELPAVQLPAHVQLPAVREQQGDILTGDIATVDTDEIPAVDDDATPPPDALPTMAQRMARLRVRDDDGDTHTIPLEPLWAGEAAAYGIGRGDDNEVHLPQRTVSRRHARLLVESGAIHIEDLASLTGVTINGHPVSGLARLGINDRIEIGGYLMWFENDEGVAPFEAPTMRIEKLDIDLSDFD